jgi:CAAX protease family protein
VSADADLPGPYPAPYGQPPVKRPWVAEPAPGTRYHQLTRTPAQRWWQPVLGTFAIFVLALSTAVTLMLAGLLVFDSGESTGGDATFADPTLNLAFNLVTIAIFLPFVLLAAWVFQRRRPGTLSSVAGRLRWRWLAICGGLAVLFTMVSVIFTWIAGLTVDQPVTQGETWVGWSRFAAPALVIALLVPAQSIAEEYFFRGWLLQSIGGWTLQTRRGRVALALSAVFRTPWPAIVISAAVFTAGHGYTGWGVLDIFCFGLVAGWVAVRTGGLEAAIAMHVANNLLAFMLLASVGRLEIEQGAVAWQYAVADIAAMALFAVAADLLARAHRVPADTR